MKPGYDDTSVVSLANGPVPFLVSPTGDQCGPGWWNAQNRIDIRDYKFNLFTAQPLDLTDRQFCLVLCVLHRLTTIPSGRLTPELWDSLRGNEALTGFVVWQRRN